MQDGIVGYGKMQKPVALVMELLETTIGMSAAERTCHWILDAGCGSGTASVAATLCGFNVVALDSSKIAVATTKARLQRPQEDLWCDVFKEICKPGSLRSGVEKAMASGGAVTSVATTPVSVAPNERAEGARVIPDAIPFLLQAPSSTR